MRTSLSLTLFIILQLSVATRGQRGRSKYRPLKTSFFDPDAGVFRRTPYNPKGSTNESPSSTTATTLGSTTSKVYKYFHHPEDVILNPSNIFDKKYKRPSLPELSYDFSIGRDDVESQEENESLLHLLNEPDVDSLKRLYDYTIGRDKEPGIVKKKKIYFDVEEVRPSEEVDNRLESEVQSINKRPKPLIKSRISKTRITTTSKPSYFLPTIATTAPIRSTTTSTIATTFTTTSAAIVTTTTTTTTTEIERSTWRTTTTTERHFRFNKKSSIRDHYRNMSKEDSRPQVAMPYPTHENTKFPHFPEQPLGSSPSIFTPKKGTANAARAAAASIRHSVGDIIQEERYREESHTTPATRTSPIDWNIKKRIRTKLNRNKKRRILTTTTTTTISTTTTSKAFRTFPPPSDESESRNNYLFTTSSDRDHRKTLRQNPDIYGSRSTTTSKPSTKEVTSTYPSYFIEDFRDPIPSPEDLRHAPPFRTYINALDQPKVPNLLDFHPSFQEQNFAPRDNFYVRLQELEHEAYPGRRKKPHHGFRRKSQRRHDRPPPPNRRGRRPHRPRPRHPNQRQRGAPHNLFQ